MQTCFYLARLTAARRAEQYERYHHQIPMSVPDNAWVAFDGELYWTSAQLRQHLTFAPSDDNYDDETREMIVILDTLNTLCTEVDNRYRCYTENRMQPCVAWVQYV